MGTTVMIECTTYRDKAKAKNAAKVVKAKLKRQRIAAEKRADA